MDKNQLQNGKSLADEIQSLLKTDPGFQQKLKQRLIDESNQVSNPFQIISSLFIKGILSDGSNTVGGIVGLKEMIVQAVITTACSNGDDAIAGLMETLEESGNSHVIAAIGTWCEDHFALAAHNGCSKPGGNPVVTAPTPADLPKEMKNAVEKKERVAVGLTREKPAVAGTQSPKQTAPSNEILVVKFHYLKDKKGPLGLQLDEERVMAHLDDGTVQLWNWHGRDDENKMINCGVKDVTCMQCDQEILVVGTAGGTVHLFDMREIKEKFSLRFGGPIHSLKFVASTLVLLTRKEDVSYLWQVDISRREMELRGRKSLAKVSQNLGLLFDLDPVNICFCESDYKSDWVISILGTRKGYGIWRYNIPSSWSEKTEVISLRVADLISTERILVAGQEDGDILVWSIYFEDDRWCVQDSMNTLQGHMHPVHHFCTVNGHLISLDKSGKVLMWSGYDLVNQGVPEPVPRVLAEDFRNVICLVGHERWFAYASSDGTISVWNLPDLWLRTG